MGAAVRRHVLLLFAMLAVPVVLVVGAPVGSAAAAPPVAATAAVPAVEIAPHRALYDLSLLSARRSSSVVDVRGRMMFEWADACDGWTVDQRFDLRFLYSGGDEMTMTTSYSTWESKDGLSYRFSVRKLVNGDETEVFRGRAAVDKLGAGGRADYVAPETRQMDLPAGTLFPSMHTVELVRRARAGDHLFLRTVFDGADADGVTDINAVIGSPTEVAPDGHDPSLFAGPGWPMRLAFFALGDSGNLPEYELNLVLVSTGVAESMEIDYGDFTVRVALNTIEPLDDLGCR